MGDKCYNVATHLLEKSICYTEPLHRNTPLNITNSHSSSPHLRVNLLFMSSKESLQWMKELMPFKFNPLPRGVAAHNFDLFHRDFLERLRVRYETSPPSVMEWFETPYLHGLLQLFSIEQRQQVMWGRKITIKSLGGFDEVLDFLAVPMKGETFVLYKEYVQELDKDMYIKKYLKSSYPIFFGDEITSRYHFDNHKLCISQRSKKKLPTIRFEEESVDYLWSKEHWHVTWNVFPPKTN